MAECRTPCSQRSPRYPDEGACPPPWPGISSLRTGDGISTRERGARSGDYRTSHLPMYIFRLLRRPPAGMATAGSAASRRDPGRPCPFSIEHILSSLPERRPATRPPQPVGGRNPAELDEPEAPVPAAPCACCCCCNPRAATRGTPETSSGPGECARRGKTRRGSRGAACGASLAPPNPNWNRNPTPDPTPPLTAPQACGWRGR